MTPVLVDSNVILDVATKDPKWCRWSTDAWARLADEAVLAVNPLIYAEVSIGYDRIEDLERALPRELFRREALPYEAAFLAGKSFLDVLSEMKCSHRSTVLAVQRGLEVTTNPALDFSVEPTDHLIVIADRSDRHG